MRDDTLRLWAMAAALPAKKKEGKTQHARFIKAAREPGVDETGSEFKKLFGKMIRKRLG